MTLARVWIAGLQPISWTLQRYIFREMAKTFVMTSVALTAVGSLGGGVLRMVQMGDVTTEQFFRLLWLVLPLSVVMTLPVAALFSAASTYGRLSADNEFVACRSSGINMHVLFLPTLVLSLFSAGVTFACINYVIPGMVRGLTEFIAADIPAYIQRRLSEPGGVGLGPGRRCYADRALIDPDNPDRVILEGVAFIEASETDWSRFGTAQTVVLQVDRSEETPLVDGVMLNVTYYDRAKGQFADTKSQQFPRNKLGQLSIRQLKYLDLKDLFYYRNHLDEWHDVREAVDRLRMQVGARALFDDLYKQWQNDGHTLTLRDAQTTLVVSAKSAARFGDGSGLQLTGVHIIEQSSGRERTCRAARADVDIARAPKLADCGIRVDAYDAVIEAEGQVTERPREAFGPLALPKATVDAVMAMPMSELLKPDPTMSKSNPLERRRLKAAGERGLTLRKIDAIISQRFAYSVSAFVLVILAAALGIVFRGAHAIVAFGISFVPSLVVMITIIMGRQMTQNAGTHLAGLSVMWSGIALVAVMDVWMLTRVVRR